MRDLVTSRACMRQMIIMGWVALGAGTLTLATAMTTNHWLRRESSGDHVGIFPCCTKLQCDKYIVTCSGDKIEAFTDIIIVGVLMVGLGWIFSLTHYCVMWKNDIRPIVGLSYVGPGLVTVGGVTLVASAIEFVATIPGDLEDALEQNCKGQTNSVATGFSYELFVTAAVAFILAGVLLFLGSCRHKTPGSRTRNNARPSVSTISMSTNVSLETVSSHLALQRTSLHHSSRTSLNNPAHSNIDSAVSVTEEQRVLMRNQLTLSGDDPHSENGMFQLPACPPSYESINNCGSYQLGHSAANERGRDTSQGCCPSFVPSAVLKPPTYEDILKEQPPPYTDSK